MGNAPSIYVISLSEWALSPWDVRVCDRKWGRITSASGKGLWTGDITISPLRVRAIFGHFLPIFCSVQTATSLCKKKKGMSTDPAVSMSVSNTTHPGYQNEGGCVVSMLHIKLLFPSLCFSFFSIVLKFVIEDKTLTL